MDLTSEKPNEATREAGTSGGCAVCSVRGFSFCGGSDGFAGMDFASVGTKSSYRPKEVICSEGDPAHRIFCLSEGTVRVFKLLPDGRRQITGFLFGGDFLGLSVLGRYVYTAEAMTAARACVFDREYFEQLCAQNPGFERRLREYSSYELAVAHDQMLTLGRKTARERVATFLLQLSHRAERRGHDALQFRLPMKRYEIADYLGLSFETVSRHLRDVERDGLIAFPVVSAVAIKDLTALRALAGYCPTD